MKKVTVKNFIRDFIFLTAAQTLSIDHQSRFPFRSFSSSFASIVEELTSLSVYSFSIMK